MPIPMATWLRCAAQTRTTTNSRERHTRSPGTRTTARATTPVLARRRRDASGSRRWRRRCHLSGGLCMRLGWSAGGRADRCPGQPNRQTAPWTRLGIRDERVRRGRPVRTCRDAPKTGKREHYTLHGPPLAVRSCTVGTEQTRLVAAASSAAAPLSFHGPEKHIDPSLTDLRSRRPGDDALLRAQRSIKWRSPGVSGCWPVGR